ncbi:hypothetical protein NP493_50g05094 [Ridgeia piscesae]|uniref:Mitochondrial import receptor subunit TOM40 n=1 Tax=Ridgeia piscesae TaxID=27915 RepID=A0AAD9PB98_RIDPI|nr:hypothetical protein NP493_50g05094 [Ridgeia piscesae]
MGNVLAAEPPKMPSPPLVPPPPTSPPDGGPPAPTPGQEGVSEDTGPGTFEDLHKKCKDVFPTPFEGAKLLINKGLSNHFQISHTMTMSTLQPSGYRFGCTYVGTKQFSPTEAFPIVIGDIDPSGNLNAQIIHQFTRAIRCKLVSQIQNNKFLATQFTTDYKGQDFTASVTLGNPDIVNESGVMVAQYLQNVTQRLSLGSELLYQYGQTVPGNEIAIYTLAGRYTGDSWQASANLTPAAGGAHLCYFHKASENLQLGVELEGSLRTQECTTTIGYQLEIPNANLTFRGQVDSNWCVSAVFEKKLPPLPFTFALSGYANHVKGTYRFGMGLIVG